MKRDIVLILAILFAGAGALCVLSFLIFFVGTLTGPDHGGDLWLALPVFLIPAVLGTFALFAAKMLFDWYRRIAKKSREA